MSTKIKYYVVKCTYDFGRTNQKTLKEFDAVEDAVLFHAEQKQTDFTWYLILVECEQKGDIGLITQTELSKATGIAQPDISKYLKQIKQGDLFRKPILKILEVQGHGEKVRAFVKEVNDEK